jgi:hypothetical protein
LFFSPEYGSHMVLRNVGWLSVDYTALYPRIQNSSHIKQVVPICLSVRISFLGLLMGFSYNLELKMYSETCQANLNSVVTFLFSRAIKRRLFCVETIYNR